MGRLNLKQRQPFHDDVVRWLGQGTPYRAVAEMIVQQYGIDVDHNVVRRYRLNHNIPVGAKVVDEPVLGRLPDPEPAQPEPSPSPQEQTSAPTQPTESPAVAPTKEVGDAVECPESLFPTPAEPVKEEPQDEPVEPASVREEQPDPDEQTVNFGQLKAMWDKGLLSEQEFQAAVRRLTGMEAPEASAPHTAAPKSDQEDEEDDQDGEAPEIPAPEPPRRKPVPFEPVAESWEPPPLPFAPLDNPPIWTPDLPILNFSQGDVWTLRDACEGTFILGSTGSGKTTGSGQTLALHFLASGFGGLVLCVKDDERQNWERYAEMTGRSEHLCVVSPGGPFRFNFLDYESQRPGVGLDWIENVTRVFHTLQEIRHRNTDNRGDPFWTEGPDALLRNALRVIAFAKRGLSLRDITQFIAEAPLSLNAVKAETWRGTTRFGPYMDEAMRVNQLRGPYPEMVQAERYWLQEFPAMPGKTRASLITIFSTLIDGFFNSNIHDLFCRNTTLLPEAVQEGAIIVVDLPLKTMDFIGLLSQCIWKHYFQKAIERRSEPRDACRRPVFLWVDEAQFLYTDYDALFQSTARSSACATVYLTQNIANFYGIYSGNRDKVNGFLGNLNTKIFHANNDQASNEWAAEQIGKTTQYKASVSFQQPQPTRNWRDALASIYRPSGGGGSTTSHIDYPVQPSAFAKLRMGAAHNDFQVDAYFTKSGARFSNGKHYFKTTFLQEF